MTTPYYFDAQSADRTERYVKRGESRRDDLGGGRSDPVFTSELVPFRVVSDLSQEAIDNGTATHGTEVTCDLASDTNADWQLGIGCLNPSGAACNRIVPCFPCNVTVTQVDGQGVAGVQGTVWTFSWSGSFFINDIDATNCSWRWATKYNPSGTESAGVELLLGNALGFQVGCQKLTIRDTDRFGTADPGGAGFTGGSYTLRATPNCESVKFYAGGVGSIWGEPYRQIYELRWVCTDQQIADGEALLEAMLPDCVLDVLNAGNGTDAGKFVVDVSFFGGSPDPGAVVLAKQLGNRWYALGSRNLTCWGDRSGSSPYRIDAGGCGERHIPFMYVNEELVLDGNGDYVPNSVSCSASDGMLHLISWSHQLRSYVATRWEGC